MPVRDEETPDESFEAYSYPASDGWVELEGDLVGRDEETEERVDAMVAVFIGRSGGHFEALRDVEEEWFRDSLLAALSAVREAERLDPWEARAVLRKLGGLTDYDRKAFERARLTLGSIAAREVEGA